MDERQEGQDRKYEVHRTKGLVPLMDGTLRIVQGVREVFEIIEPPKSEQGDSGPVPTEGKIVFIGRNLDLIEKMSGMGVTG
jgi:G3E family GTPase